MNNRTRLVSHEVEHALKGVAGWVLEGDEICREYVFRDFVEAFRFLTGVAIQAERHDHHPEMWNVYNQVRLRLTTHDAGGLTSSDFELAAAIEELL